jgi:pimeloyl-ACP methyl ester carboxylesterase
MVLKLIKVMRILVSLFLISSLLWGCESDSIPATQEPAVLNPGTLGSGFFEFGATTPTGPVIIKVYYHVPTSVTINTPILFIFHGAGRNARDYRDAMISKSEEHGFIAITPEFSMNNFPSGDQYNLGNVFLDGDNPSPATLHPESEWTFSIIEPLFEDIKSRLNTTNDDYYVFGHSAGGQFAHRLAAFKPQSRFNKMVASASGWYTVPDNSISFPYGIDNSPLASSSLTPLLAQDLIILIGDQDNNPNAASLRHNTIVDQQGLNRYDRAQHFFNRGLQLSNDLNTSFNWQLEINPGANHDYIVASQYAADLLFDH